MAVQKKNQRGGKFPKRSLSERRFGVLLEAIDKNVKLAIEGHTVLDKKIEDFRHEMRKEVSFLRLTQDLTHNQLKDLVVRIDRIEDKYDNNFEGIMKYLSRIEDEIQHFKKAVAGKADIGQIVILEKEIAEVRLAVQRHFEKK